MYRLVLFSHVLGAIVSVGPALTYGMWLALSRREGPAAQAFVSSGIRWIDSRVVTPAFGWQLVSGLLLVLVYRTADFSEPWLASSLVIYGAIALLAVTVVAPRSRRAAAALQAGGLEAQDYVAYRRLMRRLSPFISVGTLAIVFLMVVKPGR